MDVAVPTPSRRTGRFARTLGALVLRLFGWRVEGQLGAVPRAVLIAAPHTSNWDFVFMLACAYVLHLRPMWLGKQQMFRWPFGGFMRWLGGVPVNRGQRDDLVRQVVERFAATPELLLVVPPAGTRGRAPHWKSGFYHIASGAGVPIVCTFLDYHRRVGGIGPAIMPSGDLCADMDLIRDFYEGVTGMYPEQATPVRLREEDLATCNSSAAG
ncbi:MAG: lysophospholipid acyltransferase family protein [Candidatus Binatia bacterium]